MGRLYIEGDMARFERRALALVDMELYDGRKYEKLEPRRLFPLSGIDKYITLLDEEGREIAVIRSIKSLMPESRQIITECLDEYYLIPKIQSITANSEKYGVIKLFCETNKGPCVIEIRNIVHQIKTVQEKRILIRDNDDNRYEIPDINALDKKSRKRLEEYL